MSVINTNITSMIAQQNLSSSKGDLTTAMERLSSGLRINSAKDDAAGQAIANRMTSQITGLSQAQRNANDGISVAQTTEGALNQVNDNLQRIRELSVQAANGTNSAEDLESIQNEIGQRLNEINRISEETNFNGVKVLSEDQELKIQVGAKDGETISISLQQINAETLGLANLNVSNQVSSDSLTAVAGNVVTEAVAPTTVELTFSGATPSDPTLYVGTDGNLYAEDADNAGQGWAATFDPDTNTVSYNTGVASTTMADSGATSFVDANENLVELGDLSTASRDDAAGNPTFAVHQAQADGSLVITDGTDTWTVGAGGTTLDMDTGEVVLGTADSPATTIDATFDEVTTGNVMTLAGSEEVVADLTSVNEDLEGTNTLMQGEDGAYYIKNENGDSTTYHSAEVDAATGEVTVGEQAVVDPLASLDTALKTVDALRSDLGAIQNRFDSAITNLSTTETNLSAARSRIEDADYATEVANMTRAQILQQAGTSVLAQANQLPQSVLSLLG